MAALVIFRALIEYLEKYTQPDGSNLNSIASNMGGQALASSFALVSTNSVGQFG